MMYMHYCKRCHRVHMLNGHKQFCPKCQGAITELKLSYMDYVSMDAAQRITFYTCCADEDQLKRLSTTYRMYKYSKWYKERLPMENAVSLVGYEKRASLDAPERGSKS